MQHVVTTVAFLILRKKVFSYRLLSFRNKRKLRDQRCITHADLHHHQWITSTNRFAGPNSELSLRNQSRDSRNHQMQNNRVSNYIQLITDDKRIFFRHLTNWMTILPKLENFIPLQICSRGRNGNFWHFFDCQLVHKKSGCKYLAAAPPAFHFPLWISQFPYEKS